MTTEPEIAECPFCGGICLMESSRYLATLHCIRCAYRSGGELSREATIRAHNAVAAAVKAAKAAKEKGQ